MTVEEAVAARVSRRSYLDTPLSGEERAQLGMRLLQLSRIPGVRIAPVEDGAAVFSRFGKSYGLFSGVQSFLAMIGRTDDPDRGEKLGYCGELAVLQATALGLGTCWVGGTFDRAACPCPLAPEETLVCVIAFGHCPPKRGVKESIIYRFAHRGTRDLEELIEADGPLPAWFMEGAQAVRRAPSAFNRQPVRLAFADGTAAASVPGLEQHRDLDLGIAKAHFALLAGGRWPWGNGAAFDKCARGHYGMELGAALDSLIKLQFDET